MWPGLLVFLALCCGHFDGKKVGWNFGEVDEAGGTSGRILGMNGLKFWGENFLVTTHAEQAVNGVN